MTETILTQIGKIRLSINALEAQRGVLGDEVVNTALETLQGKLAVMEMWERGKV